MWYNLKRGNEEGPFESNYLILSQLLLSLKFYNFDISSFQETLLKL